MVLTGATTQLSATLKDAQGTVVTGPAVSWSSTTPGVASVSTSGLVTAAQVGHSLIVASAAGKSDTATVFVQPASLGAAVTQTVGVAGGTIEVPISAGVRLSLVIPAGALSAPVNLTATPKLPSFAGSLIAVVLSPSDLAFSKPVTLTLSLPAALGSADAQHLALALGTTSNPATLILPTSSSDGKTFTTTVALAGSAAPVGLAAVHAGRKAAAQTGDPEIDAILATTAQKIAALQAAAQELEATLKFEAAIKYRIAAAVLLQGVVDDPQRAQAEFAAAAHAACEKLELHYETAATRLGTSFQNLWAALRPVLAWTGAADAVGVNGANCPERNRLQQVLTELVQGTPTSAGFLQLYTNAMQRATFTQNFEGLADELYQALLARKYGTLLDLQAAFDNVKSQIQLPIAQRLRTAAYAWCASDHEHTYLGTLFQVARDEGMFPFGLVERVREVVDPPADLGYDAAALSDDIQYCATTLTVLSSASGGGPPREDGPFGGFGSPGRLATTGTIPAPPHGTLELDGTLKALFCPNNAYGNDRIAIEFNGQPIRELSQLVTGEFIRNATVSFNVADLLTQGQVPAHDGGSFPFKLIRKSDRCAGQYLPTGDPPDKELIALQLTVPKVTIAPTSVTLNSGETATFTATVQHSTQGVTWEVNGGGTHTESGNTLTFTAGTIGGNFSVTAKSVDDPDRSATAAVTINSQCSASAAQGSALRVSGSAAGCAELLYSVSAELGGATEDPCKPGKATPVSSDSPVSISKTCTHFNGMSWQLSAQAGGSVGHGSAQVTVSHINSPNGGGTGESHASQSLTDFVTINATGLTGTAGSFQAVVEISGTFAGSCGPDDDQQTLYTFGGAINVGQSTARALFSGVGDLLRDSCPSSSGFSQPINSTTTSATIPFVYGTPFSLTLGFAAHVSMQAGPDNPASVSTNVTYRWLGLTGLPLGATVSSASGVNWLVAVP